MRVACMGVHNTGKTTFIRDFMKEFPDYVTPGFTYRNMAGQAGITLGRKVTAISQEQIFNHLMVQITLAGMQRVIHDRCPIDAIIYGTSVLSEATYDGFVVMGLSAVRTCIDVLFHFPIAGNEHVEIKADGVRDTDIKHRRHIDRLYTEFLAAHRFALPPVHNITGSREERIAQAREVLC